MGAIRRTSAIGTTGSARRSPNEQRALGPAELPADEWLSRGYLRSHSDYPANWALLDDDAAWSQPLIRDHFPAGLRDGLVRLHGRREALLALMEGLPRTVCHLDVWHRNLVRRAGWRDRVSRLGVRG